MESFFWGIAIFMLANAFACLWRATAGPTAVDRILAVNIIGTKTLVVLVVLALVFGRSMLLDVALVYGLLNFVITVTAGRFLETGRLESERA
ncbi:MAG: monovalent cation/H+ antiporter complex subunit F [Coriobacteriia bacterium]|nr:monovalent cation/H+ antiporter complex subunit F [Coriobacteriia bacterium]